MAFNAIGGSLYDAQKNLKEQKKKIDVLGGEMVTIQKDPSARVLKPNTGGKSWIMEETKKPDL